MKNKKQHKLAAKKRYNELFKKVPYWISEMSFWIGWKECRKYLKGEAKCCRRDNNRLYVALTKINATIEMEKIEQYSSEQYSEALEYANQKWIYNNNIPKPECPLFILKQLCEESRDCN